MINTPVNSNYCATVVALDRFVDLPNCDNVKHAIVYGACVVVGKDEPAGSLGLFFPVETALSPEFMYRNNLYRDPLANHEPAFKSGFFEAHGRVKCMKFRGNKSEGFWIPLTALSHCWDTQENSDDLSQLAPGLQFDAIGEHAICSKYFSRRNPGKKNSNQIAQKKDADRLLDGQFKFHYDTPKLAWHADLIKPDTIITITDKWHGTSAVFGRLLAKRELSWKDKLAKWMGVDVQENAYEDVWASRKVIKGVGSPGARTVGYYDSDVWGLVFEKVKEKIPDGYTVYGEIVGYTGTGQAIQSFVGKAWAYGCLTGNHRFMVYRVTFTGPNSAPRDLTWLQMVDFCTRQGFETVELIYHGPAGSSFALDAINRGDTWPECFFKQVIDPLVQGRKDKHNPGFPAEGIVLTIEDGAPVRQGYKSKSFDFLEQETKALDKGEENMEDSEGTSDETIS